MANLTETAYYTRRTINWIILGFIAYIILRILWSASINLLVVLFPPKPPPPNHAFGKLPVIQFPKQSTPSGTFVYRLETISGTLPSSSSSASVYFMPKKPANLLALPKTQEFAQRLQFDSAPIRETNSVYRFEDSELPLRKLRYDIVTDNFIVRYAFEKDTSIFNERNFTSGDEAEMEAKNLLQDQNLNKSDISDGPIKTTYLKLVGDQLVQTTSLSQADAIRVDFFRGQVGGISTVTPYQDEGPISIIFSGNKNPKKKIIQFAYTYWPIDYQTTATYPLKSTGEAWQELQNGKGYIVAYPKTGNTATIRKVYLAYYESFDPQLYFQPIFVFEGDDGFLAYITAVSQEWIEM